MDWRYENEDEAIALFYVARHLKSAGFPVRLFLPYVPNARMDRVKTTSDVFTLRYFCGFINSIGFDSVEIFDPHSDVAAALLDNVSVRRPDREIAWALDQLPPDTFVFYPDEGAVKRYADIVRRPYAFGVKHRDWDTREITSYRIAGDLPEVRASALVVDDICAKGSTFERAADALRYAGFQSVSFYCSHCERTVLDGALLDRWDVNALFTTDSIFHARHDKIKVMKLL